MGNKNKAILTELLGAEAPSLPKRPLSRDSELLQELTRPIASQVATEESAVDFAIPDRYQPGNSPENPLPDSPEGFLSRAALKLGESTAELFTRGRPESTIKYLRGKYREVDYKPETGVVVKDKDGKWKQLDMQKEGVDPWTMSEFISDAAEEVAPAILPTIGGALGAISPIPGGTALGIGAGMAANRVLGKYLGTYDATPGEMASDVSIDTISYLLGNKLAGATAKGVKALGASGFVKETLGNLGKLKEGLGNVGKDAFSLLFKTSGVTSKAAKQLVSEPLEVRSEITGVLAGLTNFAKPLDQVSGELDDKITHYFKNQILQPAKQMLSTGYRSRLADALKHPDASKVSVNLSKIADPFFNMMEQRGLVKAMREKSGKVQQYILEPFEKLQATFQGAESVPFLQREAYGSLKAFVSNVNHFVKSPEQKGRAGIALALKARTSLDDFYYSAIRSNESLAPILSEFTKPLRERLFSSIKGSPEVLRKVANASNFYSKYLPMANDASRMVGQLGKEGVGNRLQYLNNYVNQYFKTNGNREFIESITSEDFAGKAGKEALTKLLNLHAAQEFIHRMPSINFHGGFSTGAVGLLRLGGTLIGVTSPRVQARVFGSLALGAKGLKLAFSQVRPDMGQAIKGLPYLMEFRKNIVDMTPEQRKGLIANPELLKMLQGVTIQAAQSEDTTQEQLLKESGLFNE